LGRNLLFVSLKLSTSEIKNISKNGTAHIAKKIRAGELKVR